MERLDKMLVSQGIGSRKEVQKLIKSGNVCVNGEICKKIDRKIDVDSDKVSVNGQAVDYQKHIYIMLNKPSGVVSATVDNHDKTVIDLVPKEYLRKGLFPAGRLDKDTEGMMIITDDGEFAHNILSPTKHIEKKYVAELDGEITDEMIKRFEDGIIFADGTKCRSAKLEIMPNSCNKKGIVTISEGKFHQVKKMFICCGVNVVQLQRISMGGLYLDGKLPIGSCKLLSNLDIELVLFGKMH